eukprot:TRINITY_DN15223_c0_g1_i2.p1 TRINITY_DN15223_c0_g1~~TRINITY_DN15223_c0_g1_i2.p1  ORF type:complete len:101 (-),score=13.21 TRINITY_DN15223_c0_g1_i2:7-309(-)
MYNLGSSTIEEFQSLSAAMFTLFRCFTDGCSAYDGTPLSERLREEFGIAFSVGYVLIMMLVTVGIFNMTHMSSSSSSTRAVVAHELACLCDHVSGVSIKS